MPTLEDRYPGTLLGLASGDALGGPVEFKDRAWIAAAYPDGLRDFVGGGWLNLAPGEITDDTQLTLAVARSLGPDGLDMARLTEEALAWYRSKPKDVGNTTRAALANLDRGVGWEEAGAQAVAAMTPERAASNGGVMRCAPVALRFRREPERLVAASLDQARITHAEPRAMWAAVAVNQAIAHLLNGGDLGGVAAAAVAGVPNDELVWEIVASADAPREAVSGRGGAVATTGGAFWALLHAPNAEEAIVAAVGLGDDTDTVGAVAGAMAGAWQGVQALPARWLDLLQPREELEAHARRLLALSVADEANDGD